MYKIGDFVKTNIILNKALFQHTPDEETEMETGSEYITQCHASHTLYTMSFENDTCISFLFRLFVYNYGYCCNMVSINLIL